MQFAFDRAKVGSRAAQWINPKKDELLIPDRETAYRLIDKFEKQLTGRLPWHKNTRGSIPAHKKAELLIAKSMIYEALGDQRMMEAAEEAFKVTKTSITAHMMAVAHHHFGRLAAACKFYELAYRFPHEAGFNVDLAYTQALLFQGRWSEAHQMTLGLKKRMVYAAYLPEWDRCSTDLSIISEGGYGDLIHCGRWIPIIRDMGVKATVYLPPYFFESGFVGLWKHQKWCPEIKLLTETPQNVPAVGFFDLPAVFDVQPDVIPPSLTFKADCTKASKYAYLHENVQKPVVGFCWAARAMEVPLCPDGVYRSLTEQQAVRIIQQTSDKVSLVNLQLNETLPGLQNPEIKSWEDTAAIIENLDAVVTVDTAVAHLAAAMNKPTYVLLSGASDWKFGLEGKTCGWYPSMRVIRNNDFGFDNAVELLSSIRFDEVLQSLNCNA